MLPNYQHTKALETNGFSIINQVYSSQEVTAILQKINEADTSKETFRKSADVFAIRQFLKEIPAIKPLVFNQQLTTIIAQIFGPDFFVVKSIYFDKPETSNWYVSYHQDLTISVNQKTNMEGFSPWTKKQNQFAVQPPTDILARNYTIRIHLDDTDENNGALKVINGSHLKGIYRPETMNRNAETETTCNVTQGGIMLMKPLLLHSSGRTTNHKKRRVIHIEFSNRILPPNIQWSEQITVF